MTFTTRSTTAPATPPATGPTAVPSPPSATAVASEPRFTTPRLIWAGVATVTVATLLVFLALAGGVSNARAGTKAIGADSVPSINYALDVYAGMSNMDADVANYLLLMNHPSKDLSLPQVTADYESNLQTVSDRLVSASQNITYGYLERKPILSMVAGAHHFADLVARVELLADQHQDAQAIVAMRQATTLMHDPGQGLLAQAARLEVANHNGLANGYNRARSDARTSEIEIALAGVLLVAALVGLQIFLSRRTRRTLNVALLIATVAAVAVPTAGIVVMNSEAHHLKVAKVDAYDSVYALKRAKAVAADANADESRFLVDPQMGQSYEQAFLDKSTSLVAFDHADTIQTYDAAMATTLQQLQTGIPAVTGSFGDALHNITFVGELDAAKATMQTFAVYEQRDRVLRVDAARGDIAEAVRFDTSYKPEDSNGAFLAFNNALDKWIEINQGAFDGAIKSAHDATGGWSAYPWILALGVIALTFVAVRPRLKEYR